MSIKGLQSGTSPLTLPKGFYFFKVYGVLVFRKCVFESILLHFDFT